MNTLRIRLQALYMSIPACLAAVSLVQGQSNSAWPFPSAQKPSPAPAASTPPVATAAQSATGDAAAGKVDRAAFKDFKLPENIMQEVMASRVSFPGSGTKPQNGAQKQSYALYMTALMTCINPEGGTSGALLSQIRGLLQPGHEPNAAGGLDGWTHNAIAQAFLLVKKTPEVWNQLSSDEKNRMDWIMKAMAVTGHFFFDDENDYITSLHADGNAYKKWNPNHRLYLFVVLAAADYFGPDQLNEIYKNFSYDDYIKKFDELGFSNIKAVWTCYDWKPLMENGGTFTFPKTGQPKGTGKGVKHPFTYKGIPLTDIAGIYCAVTSDNYDQKVTNGVEGKSWILNNGVSPFLGQDGMMAEFNSHDAEGIRSDLDYCEEDFCPYTTMLMTLKVIGQWPSTDTTRKLEKLMYVGNEDFLFKNNTGFHSFSHNKGRDTSHLENVKWLAFPYVKALWDGYLKDKLKP